MKIPLHLIKISDLTPPHIEMIIATAFEFKGKKDKKSSRKVLGGKTVALIFEKNSLRTRVAFENAVSYLGGHAIFLSAENILYRATDDTSRETVADITRNLDRLADGIAARVNSHATLCEIAQISANPVINLLCDEHHPTQALADLMVIRWYKGNKKNLKVAFIGDGNNVATSLMEVCAAVGVHFSIASPARYAIEERLRVPAKKFAKKSGSQLRFVSDPHQAATDADIVYTDTFVSMGDEAESVARNRAFNKFRVDAALMKRAQPDAIFLHCLPAHRGDEVTSEVIDGPQSAVFDQAECRLHVAKALLFLMYARESDRQQV